MAQTMTMRLYRTTLMAKAIMAVSGVILFGFLIGHMIGNLQVFDFMGGQKALDSYGKFLHETKALLWGTRIVLLVAIIAHVASAIRLVQLNAAARPIAYKHLKPRRSTYASRTMKYSGPIISLYILYHLAHFTFGLGVDGYNVATVHHNVVTSFGNPLIALIYVAANSLLGVHLWHGTWSFMQSLGLSHPKYDPLRRTVATGLTVFIIGGFLSVPIGVMLGLAG